jgi:hypothetical protein
MIILYGNTYTTHNILPPNVIVVDVAMCEAPCRLFNMKNFHFHFETSGCDRAHLWCCTIFYSFFETKVCYLSEGWVRTLQEYQMRQFFILVGEPSNIFKNHDFHQPLKVSKLAKPTHFLDFYLPHMEYEGSIGLVMRKNLMR